MTSALMMRRLRKEGGARRPRVVIDLTGPSQRMLAVRVLSRTNTDEDEDAKGDEPLSPCTSSGGEPLSPMSPLSKSSQMGIHRGDIEGYRRPPNQRMEALGATSSLPSQSDLTDVASDIFGKMRQIVSNDWQTQCCKSTAEPDMAEIPRAERWNSKGPQGAPGRSPRFV